MVVFHCWLGIWLQLVPYEQTAALTARHPVPRIAAVGGPLAVDAFLVVGAMLAAYQLLPQLERAAAPGGGGAWRAVRGYWRRRALRLLPCYLAVVFLSAVGAPADLAAPEARAARGTCHIDCPRGTWLNLALLTHQRWKESCGELRALRGECGPRHLFGQHGPPACKMHHPDQHLRLAPSSPAGLQLWSLTLQLHFCLLFPLALLALRPGAPAFRARLAAALAAAVVGGTAWRLWRACTQPHLALPIGDIYGVAEDAAGYGAALDAGYFHAGTRFGELALGAALGLLLRSHRAVSWLRRRRWLVTAAAVGCQACWLCLHVWWNPLASPGPQPKWSLTPTRLYIALAYYGSPFIATTVCATLLALFLRPNPLHAALAAALSSPKLLPAATLSYCLYLIHELARLWGLLLLLPLLPAGALAAWVAAAPVAGLLGLAAFTLAAGYACAWLLHVGIEQRF